MTITELIEIVSDRTGAERDVVHGFFQSFVDVIVERLDAGDEVKIRGLGAFRWITVPEKKLHLSNIPGGVKLRFFPAKQFRSRRIEEMSEEEGMDKLGVVLDDDKTKTATEAPVNACPVCLNELDNAGACPVHGTEPFEPVE